MSGTLDWTGSRLVLEVGPVAHGGHCVARYEGRVVFVRHALPGEKVVAEVTEDAGGSFCRADAVEIRTPAPGRVSPSCELAELSRGRDRCGGCDWQHASEETQLELKAAVVTEQLERLAGIHYPVSVQALSRGPLRWRTRVRLAVDDDGRPGFRPHRSHRVIPVQDCPITVPGALEHVTSKKWAPGTELAITSDSEETVHVNQTYPKRRGQRVQGPGVAQERAAGRQWRVAADGFWQVHPEAATVLAETVRKAVQLEAGAVAWDLYGGVGLFAAVLAEQVGSSGSIVLVESSKDAVRDAKRNLAKLPQVRCVHGRVEKVIASDESLGRPDVVVLDPPRKGAGRTVVDGVAGRQPGRVVYVACDPAALARDIGLFRQHGYEVDTIEGFDTFPMTHHVECVAVLVRASE